MHNTFPIFNTIMHHSRSTEALPSITSWQPSCLIVLSVTQEALIVSISHSTQNRHIPTALFTPYLFYPKFPPLPTMICWCVWRPAFNKPTGWIDLGTRRQWQNANTRNPNTKNALPNPQSQKSVAFHALAFCPWHYGYWVKHPLWHIPFINFEHTVSMRGLFW